VSGRDAALLLISKKETPSLQPADITLIAILNDVARLGVNNDILSCSYLSRMDIQVVSRHLDKLG
jgi:hypothetical protein